MKNCFRLLLSLFLFYRALTVAADPVLQSHDRLAICGDTASSRLGYSVFIEEYLLACQPVDMGDIAEFGLNAGTAREFCDRLDTDLFPFKPTVVMTNFGASETGDMPLDDAAANAWRKTQTDLIDTLKKDGVRTIIVGSPKCADSTGYHQSPAQVAIRNKNLGVLADIDRDVAAREGVIYADVFGATMAAMTKARALYGDQYVFDNGHPGNPCSLVMAYAFLNALECSGDIGSLTVTDFATNRARCSPGQWITYMDHTLSVESTRFPFWWYRGNSTSPTILKCIPFDDELNRYLLIVKNLPTARAKITWGNEDHDFSAEQLAVGINLSREYARTPFSDFFDIVTHCLFDQQQLAQTSAQSSTDHEKDSQSAAPWNSLVQSTIARLIHVIRHSQRQIIAIQPLAEVEKQPPGPIPVIVDTDLDGDVDDVGAVALLNDFMDQGEAKLIACVHNTSNVQLSSCATIHAINAYYGHPSILIGQSYGEKGPATPMKSVLLPAPPEGYHGVPGPFNSSYTLQIHQRFDPDFSNDDKLPAGVDVYRKALASAADGTVVICSIGTMENVQDLILSQPDSVSNLSGLDLVRKKVRELVIMANTVPQDHYLLSKWPTKIMWTTYVGNGIGTGPSLLKTPENNPVRMAYDLFGVLHTGRQSWDLTAAWLAVRGPGNVWDVVAGRPQYINDITHTPTAPHRNESEVTVKMSYPDAARLIGDELARSPKF